MLRRLAAIGVLLLTVGAAMPHGGGSGGGAGLITTITLVNDATTADTCTGITNCMPLEDQGIWFPDNTICNGTAPVFTDGGVTETYSYGMLTYWGWSGQGYISGTTLTVTTTTAGGIGIGETVNGAASGTTVTAFAGFVSNQSTYTVSVSQTLGSSGSPVSLTVGGCLRGGTFRIARSPSGTLSAPASASFTGSISGTALTVSGVTGTIAAGQVLSCVPAAGAGGACPTTAVAAGTTIVSGSGTSWTVSVSQTVSSEAMLASTTRTISVSRGGAWPSASSRTITDAYNQNLITTICAAGITCAGTGTAVTGANLDGVWKFNLQGDPNNFNVTKWMTGGAGEGFKVRAWFVETFTANTNGTTTLNSISFADGKTTAVLTNNQTINCSSDVSNLTITIASGTSLTLSSAASGSHTGVTCTVQHGQLVFDAYIDVLNNSSGNLGAFRFDGAATQPFYNSDIPSKNFRAIAQPVYAVNGTVSNGPNWQVCQGVGSCVAAPGNQSGAIPLSFGGSDGNPIVSQATSVSGGVMSTTASNNWWYGSPWTDDGNYTAGYFTGSPVTSSPQVDTSHIYWVLSSQQNGSGYLATSSFQSVHLSGPGGGSQASGITFSGSGANGTFNPVPVIEPGTRVWFVNSAAKPNFFQGTGTITAETTLRAQINQTYLVSTHAILPYDLSISGVTKGGSVHSSYFNEPVANYNPWNFGHTFGHQQAGGDHPDLGPDPDDAAVAFYNDTALDDFVVRTDGLSAGNSPAAFQDKGTHTILDLIGTNGSPSAYTGFPTSVSTSVVAGIGTGVCAGYTCPPQPTWSTTFLNIDATHKPAYSSFAYVKTGRLEMLDLTVEQAQWGLLASQTSITNRNPTDASTGSTVRGINQGFCCDPRGQAWANRDIQKAAGYYPLDPTGTATTYGCSNAACSGGSDVAVGKYLDQWARNNTSFAHHQSDPANSAYGSQTAFVAGCATAPATPCTSSGYNFAIELNGANIDSGVTTLGVFNDFSGEEGNYQVWAYLFAAMLRNDPEAIQVLHYWISGQETLLSQAGGYNTYLFVSHIATNDTNSFGKPPISDLGHFASKIEGGPFGPATVTWQNSSPAFHVFSLNGQTINNGDRLMFCSSAEGSDNSQCDVYPPAAATFTGSTTGSTLTISSGITGTVAIGQALVDQVNGVRLATITGGSGTSWTISPSQTVGSESMSTSNYIQYTPYYVANVTTVTAGAEYTFDLKPCSSIAANGNCSTLGSVILPGLAQASQIGLAGWYMDASPPGTGVAGSSQQPISIAYYGAYMTYRFLFGNNNSVGPLLTDILARLSTDGFSPATGSASASTGNPGGYNPRYSEHY